jgi:hypothetical protein
VDLPFSLSSALSQFPSNFTALAGSLLSFTSENFAVDSAIDGGKMVVWWLTELTENGVEGNHII